MNTATKIGSPAIQPNHRPIATRAATTDPQLGGPADLGTTHDVRLPRANASSAEGIEDIALRFDRLVGDAKSVLASLDAERVDIHALLMKVATLTRLDQQGSLEQAQNTIDVNRNLRARIQELVKKIQEEIQKLQEEIDDLRNELENQNVFEKAGEGIAGAFGGGKGKELQKKQANLTIKQGRLKEAEAGLEKAKKLIEHGHQILEQSVQDLKKIVERINRSIDLVRDAVNQETTAVGRA